MTKTVTKVVKAKPDWDNIVGLYLQGFGPTAISTKTGIHVNTIKVGLSKRKVKGQRDIAVAKQREEGRSGRLKEKLGEVAESIVDTLSNRTPSDPDGLNQHADTAQKVAKTASLIYGWGEGAQVAIIVPGVLNMRPEPEAIDVESSSEPASE